MSSARPEITAILMRWPSRQAIADDVGVEPIAVYRWQKRGSIPGKHDAALLASAARHGIPLSAQELVNLRSQHSEQSGHCDAAIQGGAA